jgi:co-chaperonin GroES (HSP10)
MIHVPDIAQNIYNTFCGIIIKVGNKVKDYLVQENRMCFFDQKLITAKDGNDLFVLPESSIILIKDSMGAFRPLGNRVLVERDIQEKNKVITRDDGSVVQLVTQLEAYPGSDQSLEGWAYRRGIKNGIVVELPFEIGDKVHLKTWLPTMIEVSVEDKYLLSVEIPDVLYKHEVAFP